METTIERYKDVLVGNYPVDRYRSRSHLIAIIKLNPFLLDIRN